MKIVWFTEKFTLKMAELYGYPATWLKLRAIIVGGGHFWATSQELSVFSTAYIILYYIILYIYTILNSPIP